MLRDLGVESRIVLNNIASGELDELDGLLLSGGAPSIVSELNKLKNMEEYIKKHSYPIFGICVGAQFISLYFGGSVKPTKHPEFGKTAINFIDHGGIFYGLLDKITVWENHNDEIKNLTDDFVIAASSETCSIQAFYHRKKPIYQM